MEQKGADNQFANNERFFSPPKQISLQIFFIVVNSTTDYASSEINQTSTLK